MLVWQEEKWGEILKSARAKMVSVGWVAARQKGDHPAHILNNQVDSVTALAVLAEEKEAGQEEKWRYLLEWLHVKHGCSGIEDLLREMVSRGWPVTQRACETVIFVCSQCCTRLDRHPLQDPPLHLRMGKGRGKFGRSTALVLLTNQKENNVY